MVFTFPFSLLLICPLCVYMKLKKKPDAQKAADEAAADAS